MGERSHLMPIFAIVLIDILGLAMVVPLLPFHAEHLGASPLVAGSLVSVYGVCALISTPIIGRLSDQRGRKPLLMYSQAGACAGLLAIGLSGSLALVFVGRMLSGLAAGSQAIAQAYIADHTAPQDRARAFGIISVAFGIGFVIGPALGGWLGGKALHLPFLAAAGASAAALVLTFVLLPGERPRDPAEAAPPGPRPGPFSPRVYAEYLGRPALRALYAQSLLFALAWSYFLSGFSLFAKHNPHFFWSIEEVGYLFAYAGALGILLQGGLLGRMVRRFGEVKITIASFAAATAAYTTVGFAQSLAVLVIAATLNTFGQGVLRPVLNARLTQAVARHEQGVVLGISSSLVSLAMIVAPPLGGAVLGASGGPAPPRTAIADGRLIAWALIPAALSLVGLAAALTWSRRDRAPSAGPARGG